MSAFPPLRIPSTTSESFSSSGSRKSLRSNSSDSPSASATEEHGRDELDRRLRSVLSHRLGIPLLYAFHEKDPSTLSQLGQELAVWVQKITTNRACSQKQQSTRNSVLQSAVEEWKKGEYKQNEPQLTKILSTKINQLSECFHAFEQLTVKEPNKPDGRIDMVFSTADSKNEERETTPLTVIEFGLSCKDWWKKLDQGIMYLDRMRRFQKTNCVRFQKPLLLAIVTIDNGREQPDGSDNFRMRLGVFLCSRKNTNVDSDVFRMSLLWHSQVSTLADASLMFGTLIRVSSLFKDLRDGAGHEDDSNQYEYFSSNCCRIADFVSLNIMEIPHPPSLCTALIRRLCPLACVLFTGGSELR